MHTTAAHTEALRALARISLTVMVVGCIEDPRLDDPGDADPERADAATPEVEPDLALPPIVPDAAIFVDALVDGAVDSEPVEEDAGSDAETTDPADMAIADMAGPCIPEEFSDFEAFWACCEANGFPMGACTPWGPPTPPRFDRGLA